MDLKRKISAFLVIYSLRVAWVLCQNNPGKSPSPGYSQSVNDHFQGGLEKKSVERRQVSSSLLESITDCASTISSWTCTSGFAQDLVNLALECGDRTLAVAIAGGCSLTAIGKSCTETVSVFKSLDLAGASTCLLPFRCPSTCRNVLQSVSDAVGCCFNSLFNNSANALFDIVQNFVDNSLWERCLSLIHI